MLLYDNELQHYGVKGMKWGVRRARKQVNRINKDIARLDNVTKRVEKHGNKAETTIGYQQKLQADRFANGNPAKMPRVEKQLFKLHKQNVKNLNKAVKKGDRILSDIDKRSAKADKLLEKYGGYKVVTRTSKDGQTYIDLVEE